LHGEEKDEKWKKGTSGQYEGRFSEGYAGSKRSLRQGSKVRLERFKGL
jgi:hypothetical protein